MNADELLRRDRAHVWHPYTQHATEPDPLPVVGAHEATLELADGTQVLDGISSWWACLHGHGNPVLLEAMAKQAARLDHVLFAGATHEPAVRLAEQLCEATPGDLTRVFYSDDGSTAVEIALKLTYQAWVHAGEPQRTVFVALEGGFHGETFGSMSIGDPVPFFENFAPLLFRSERVPADAEHVRSALARLKDSVAAVVLEPMLQGAAGMRMQSPEFLRAVRAACDEHGIPLIADEVMTGFGRTGKLFACEHAGIAPDVLCLAKGLSGGLFPIAATLTTESAFEAFLSPDRSRAFFHGHTFTAHPVGCAIALASLQLCRENEVPSRFERIGQRISERLKGSLAAKGAKTASDVRTLGGIVAVDLAVDPADGSGYLAQIAPRLRAESLKQGVLLRPLGDVLYAMPPACTTDAECDRIADVMAELV